MEIISKNNKIIYIFMFLVAVLLYLRDVRGIYISKNIFLLIIVPVLFLSSIKDGLMLWFFLMPLYVGLPGNYITLVILFKFLLFHGMKGKFKLYKNQFILTFFFAIFIFVQNIYYGYFGIYYMIFIIELFVVYFLMTTNLDNYFSELILSYSAGVFTTGLVMLFYTLSVYNISDLLNVAARLGYLGRVEKMSVMVDPNYYGLFAITVISCNCLLILRKKYTFFQKILGMIFSVGVLIIAIIGMSRAFVLCLILFIIFNIFIKNNLDKNIKIKFMFFILICVCIVFYLFPDIIQKILTRFNGADMATGNGRTVILGDMLKEWNQSVYSILFGIGLFNCNAHFMQMQYFTGCGLLGMTLVVGLAISYFSFFKKRVKKIEKNTLIPIVITQISAMSVPIAQSLTFMMPVIISLLMFGNINKKRKNVI